MTIEETNEKTHWEKMKQLRQSAIKKMGGFYCRKRILLEKDFSCGLKKDQDKKFLVHPNGKESMSKYLSLLKGMIFLSLYRVLTEQKPQTLTDSIYCAKTSTGESTCLSGV